MCWCQFPLNKHQYEIRCHFGFIAETNMKVTSNMCNTYFKKCIRYIKWMYMIFHGVPATSICPQQLIECFTFDTSISICLCMCPSAMTLKWHNIVNSQYIAIQLYMRVDTPLRYVAIEIRHPSSTRTTAFVTTLSVSPKSFKCNISITNYPIALKFGQTFYFGGQIRVDKPNSEQIITT